MSAVYKSAERPTRGEQTCGELNSVAKAIELELAIMNGPSEFAHLYDGSSKVGQRLARVAISALDRVRATAA